jgi:SAM-dependent methyltransferase
MAGDDWEPWFAHNREVLETAYLAKTEPWAQSGMSGPFERWRALRKPVVDCIDQDGTFLDVGCANGYLLECCKSWAAERGVRVEPFGVDFSEKLIGLARERLPEHRDNFWTANAFEWVPPRRFTFVRTDLCYAPAELEEEYVRHLLAHFVEPGGRLLIASYGEGQPDPEHGLLPGQYPTRFILDRLQTLGIPVSGYQDGFDTITPKGGQVQVAVVMPEEIK